ncbi:uncharacterized protein LOC123260862 [Cotesia glomerata]|uniref:Uncharacterized protein n=1 Tax=Cotesia glomerata TaxID=32391 RepID=A0AAV7IDA4_COTGL|nr:uncharacterized protein LOC123260862 [Cotesia glomerata]KAH0549112.1 hypothetical protein KQX54_006180 [Cotesia glomerata]
MECQKTTLALILCLFAVAVVGILGAPADFQDDRFTTKCLNESVLVSFEQLFYDLRMYTAESEPGDFNSDCSRTFTPNEPAVKEFNFKKCSYGSRKMKVYVDEIYEGKVFNTPVVKIDCETTLGDAVGSVIGAYIDIFSH